MGNNNSDEQVHMARLLCTKFSLLNKFSKHQKKNFMMTKSQIECPMVRSSIRCLGKLHFNVIFSPTFSFPEQNKIDDFTHNGF